MPQNLSWCLASRIPRAPDHERPLRAKTCRPLPSSHAQARDRLATRKHGEINPLVDPDGLLKQLASLRARAEQRLEAERKAGC